MENENNLTLEELVLKAKSSIEQYASEEHGGIHAYDIKETLLEIYDKDEELFFDILKTASATVFADVLSEFPVNLQEVIANKFGSTKLARITSEMDTDDAADFIQIVSEEDEEKAEQILKRINQEDQEDIRSLISYDEDEAGSLMQKELFRATISEEVGSSLERLREMKREGEIENISFVFITEDDGRLICSIGLQELILFNPKKKYGELFNIEDKKASAKTVRHRDPVKDVVEKVSSYNLSTIAVVDDEGKLTGRITSDDIYDLMNEQATEEIYSMAGLNADAESTEDLKLVAYNRAGWLALNLLTAVAASLVISYFDSTIKSFVALAVLMPIVASMGGNAGTQSLTVTVRQLSLGEISEDDAMYTIKREVILSILNGLIFALVIGVFAHLWFGLTNLGYVIALSTVINLFVAGLFGAVIPMFLEKLDVDPAIGSTVLLTTMTDVVGFFSFLGLAKLLM